MMKFIIVLLIAARGCEMPVAKSFHNDQDRQYNSISPASIKAMGVALGDSKDDIIKKIGEPDTVVKQVNEFNGDIFYQYRYQKYTFVVSKSDSLVSFQLQSGTVSITSHEVSVGSSKNVLKELFPLSFMNMQDKD